MTRVGVVTAVAWLLFGIPGLAAVAIAAGTWILVDRCDQIGAE